MKHFLFLVIVLIDLVAFGQGQTTYMQNRIMMERAASGLGSGNTIVTGLGSPPPETVGSVYLSEKYQTATFLMNGEENVSSPYKARLDLQRNEFDLDLGPGRGVRVLPSEKVKSALFVDTELQTSQYYINAAGFRNEEGEPYLGFFELLSEGELLLLKLTRLNLIPADRSLSHNTGNRENRFVKKEEIYYTKGTVTEKIPKRKGILELMQSQKEAVETYIKVNDLNLSSEKHLIAVFNYYNSLTKK